MAVIENTTVANDVVKALDIEFAQNFNGEVSALAKVLGIVSPEVVAAGTALYQYSVSGSLSDSSVTEGDEVPLSKYTVTKSPVGAIELKPYRKLTTAQAIAKGGFENAILRTDKKMLKDVRAAIVSKFFDYFQAGTTAAFASTLQAAIAQADAALSNKMETNGDSADRIVHFVNTFDIADYLATATVSMQTVFGMNYLASFLGVNDIFITNKVPSGTVLVTPAENIHIYGVDFGALGDAGLSYTVYDGSLVGVNHEAEYSRVSAITNVLTGMTILAEVTDYIVTATFNTPDATWSLNQLKAYATANSISIASLTTKADILAAILTALES